MIHHAWTILCRGSSTDKESNNITLFEVVEQVATPLTPELQDLAKKSSALTPLTFELITLWSREQADVPAKGEVVVEIKSPSGSTKKLGQYDVDLTTKMRARASATMPGLPVSEEGLHWITVSIRIFTNGDDLRAVGRLPLQVSGIPREMIQSPSVTSNGDHR